MLAIGQSSCSKQSLVPYTEAQEKDVRAFITIGMEEKAVMEKYGPPNLTNAGTDGSEIWQYLADPRVVRDTHSSYAGFEVFFKDKKVTYFGIIRARQN